MKIQLLSDLHLEAHPQFTPEPAPAADVLVLAGDIGSYQEGGLLADTSFGLERFSPLPQFAGWPVPVLLVPGNHEYDAQDFDAAHHRLRTVCDQLGIAWLERETLVLDGVRFVGTTLWSDFDALADHENSTDLTHSLKLRDKAYRAANFYLRKTGATRDGEPFLAEQVRTQALLCQQWLRDALARPHPACAVPIHAMGWCPARPAFAMPWTSCCPWRNCGCTGTCTHPATTRWAAPTSMVRPGSAA